MEIMIASAILILIGLAISRLLTNSFRGLSKSDSALSRQLLERQITLMAGSQAARCNSIKADPTALSCALMCQACRAGIAGCTAGGGDCRNFVDCSDSGNPKFTVLKDLSSTLDTRPGGDGLAGLTLVGLNLIGNKVTDSGMPCDGAYSAASSACRWRVTAKYQPDYNDSMRYFFTIAYEPNESDDPDKYPVRSWQAIVPVDDLCSTL